MKKSILSLGKSLNKATQRKINGGITGCPSASYFVNSCSECINTILAGEPTICHKNCCIQAF